MQFLAVRSDRQAPVETIGKYIHKLDVPCYKCNAVTYQLCAPLLEAEEEAVQAQGVWLNHYLPQRCPDHPDSFLTPDRAGME